MTHLLVRYFAFALLTAGLTAIAFVAGFGSAMRIQGAAVVAARPEIAGVFRTFWESWQFIEGSYVDQSKVDSQRMTYGAINGVVASLGDPYAQFLDPSHFRRESDALGGQFFGIGATVSQNDAKELVIVTPLEGSPAIRAGLLAGTRILAVDGTTVTQFTIEDAVARIRGPRGTVVRLTVVPPGETEPRDVAVTRDEVRTPSVASRMLEPEVGYVQLRSFTARSKDEIVESFQKLRAEGARRFVFDLRQNPGGLLQSAVDVASQFLAEGVVLYQVRGDGTRTTYDVKAGGAITGDRLVVLVDKGSASSSEVVSGALRDHKRAVLVGEKTFGKGTVTQLRPLSDGSAVNLPVARWMTPNGQLIEGLGITPDVVVPFSDADRAAGRDPQLERALELLRAPVA